MFHALSRPWGRLRALLTVLLLAPLVVQVFSPAMAGPPSTHRAEARDHPAGRAVVKGACRRIDPNLVHGTCLRYRSGAGTRLTWIGSYRAPDGRVFFCIDYLYDSRLPAHARLLSTRGLVNQLDESVGDVDVATLNALISRVARHGSTGSDVRDAAVALLVREVMADGIGAGGTVVYPPGLRSGGPVRSPRGGVPAAVLDTARRMWAEASRRRGPYTIELDHRGHGPLLLGRSRTYRLAVRAASGRLVPGVAVHLACHGPVRCPDVVRTSSRPEPVRLHPRGLGRFTLAARAHGPAADGRLYVAPGWHTHPGRVAADAGTQRGWIAASSTARASVSASAAIVPARPRVSTRASDALAVPGAALHDDVIVAGLPAGHRPLVTATLYGPYPEAPTAQACAEEDAVASVTLRVPHDGTWSTPSVTAPAVGHYVWRESLPGDRATRAVVTPCGVTEETTLVRRLTPLVSTVASHQRVRVGRPVHDTVSVSGIESQPVSVRWTLHGPLEPREAGQRASCEGLSWTHAPVAATGTIAFAGDGTRTTEPTLLRAGGCYTYSEDIPATATTEAAHSTAGQVTETSLVLRRRPRLHTTVSTHRARTGHRLRDSVRVSGLDDHDRVAIDWHLWGPVAPHGGHCSGLDWSEARSAEHGTVRATGSGTVHSPWVTLLAPGCYTFSEDLAVTDVTEAASSPAGLPSETALITRPALGGAPAVPSGVGSAELGGAGTDPRFYRAPRRLVHSDAGGRLAVPSVGIDATIDTVGLDGPVLAIPGDVQHVGWLDRTATADDVVGSAVLAGHVSDRHDRPGALWRLHAVRVGALITWRDATGEHRFRVARIHRYPRGHGLPDSVFATDGPHLLRIITCTARRSTGGGHFHYADDLVVTAVPVP